MNIDEALRSAEEALKFSAGNDFTDYNGIKESVEAAFREIQAAMFPSHVNPEGKSVSENLLSASEHLRSAITRLMNASDGEKFTAMLIMKLPEIKRLLLNFKLN